MRSAVRKMGNSSGVIIPKPLLAEIGLAAGDTVDLAVRRGVLVVVPVKHARSGWSEDARGIAEAGEDSLVLGDFGNAGDEEFSW